MLRRIGGCESSYAHTPDGELVWTRLNGQGSSASGGFQILDGTWRSWARAYGEDVGAPAFARASHAPWWVQQTVAVRAFAAQGTRPWASSAYCWR